ncbi:MAG TPA: DnaA regulatory inactivator Hda [Burkholderiales bacterium]
MTGQLALDLRLRDGSSFENYHSADNREAVERLRGLLRDPPAVSGPRSLYLWGEPASGKTHLLEAACRHVTAQGAPARYVPLSMPGISPVVLEEAERAFLICLDGAQHVAGDRGWESALFACYELARTAGARLLVTASTAPAHAGFTMPELTTRFAGGSVYQLHGLRDDAKIAAMQLRARNRGFDLPPDVGRYILQRYPRDPVSLFALLDRIDAASLARQRRITIPFLREFETEAI